MNILAIYIVKYGLRSEIFFFLFDCNKCLRYMPNFFFVILQISDYNFFTIFFYLTKGRNHISINSMFFYGPSNIYINSILYSTW